MASVEAGADALGFIFAPSKRRVTPEAAQAIIRELPSSVERIGVFLNGTLEEIGDAVMKVDLTGIQLHGQETAGQIYDSLPPGRRDSLRIIKTVIARESFTDQLKAAERVDAWLLDSGTGSGLVFDWQAALKQLSAQHGRFIIAGGLTPNNVGEAIRAFSPWGVDVVSGIEAEAGRKDSVKLKAFVVAVRKAEKS
jgi:phosphoribosylanthranilate isomerase